MAGNHEDVPRFELHEPVAAELEILRRLQRVLLTHPVAAQAAFTSLVSEGRRFLETEEGRQWQQRLSSSALLRQVRLVFDLATLGLLEETSDGTVPSSYLDALFMVASGGDADAVLNRLFWTGDSHDPESN